jgi:Luciferase-like monooxygenase
MTTERIADHVKFAYWVPNVSGGLVTSDIEQRTDWNYEYNANLAQTAENNGFEYALSQVRYEASYGAEYQHESTSFSLALLLATQRLKVIAAVHLILGGFLHFQEDIEYFGSRVLPLVREIEDSEADSVDSPVLVSA